MSKVIVWMPVRNEARFLQQAIDSVLAQTFRDFTLVISDNCSTDDSWGVIKAALKDPRVMYIKQPEPLAGIPHMKYLWDRITRDEPGQQYTIHIGGHDLWPDNYLETLVSRADEHPGSPPAIVYADTWQIDENGNAYARYKDVLQVEQMGRPLIPQFVISGVNSPQVFGLWNESIRRKVPFRHATSGWDHLIIAEAALHGPILFEGRTSFLMRGTNTDADLSDYGRRHLSTETLTQGPQDFLNQLEWMQHCVDLATAELPEEAKPMYRALLTASMFATYLALRGQNLHVVPGAMAEFNQLPEVRQCFGAIAAIDANVRKLLDV
jgi:Glycosyl transferase family 2